MADDLTFGDKFASFIGLTTTVLVGIMLGEDVNISEYTDASDVANDGKILGEYDRVYVAVLVGDEVRSIVEVDVGSIIGTVVTISFVVLVLQHHNYTRFWQC